MCVSSSGALKTLKQRSSQQQFGSAHNPAPLLKTPPLLQKAPPTSVLTRKFMFDDVGRSEGNQAVLRYCSDQLLKYWRPKVLGYWGTTVLGYWGIVILHVEVLRYSTTKEIKFLKY